MKIKIEPIQHFVPGKGLVTASVVNVEVAQFRLNDGVKGSYEVLAEEQRAGEDKPRPFGLVNGSVELTREQFLKWNANDGLQFARYIVTNAGLKAAE